MKHQYAELMAAHGAGKVIQWHNGQTWIDHILPDNWEPIWIHPVKDLRIKPTPSTFTAHGKEWTKHVPGDEIHMKTIARADKAEAELAAVHCILDNDESKIIRNAKDGYPEGREARVLTLAERVKSLCIYAADWKRWTEEKEVELTRWQSLAERLATALDDCNTKLVGWHGLYPSQVGSDDEATFQAGDKALAAYESAKSGNLHDPLDEAVKRMEEVPVSAMFDNSELPFVDPVIVSTIRARLIAAAKGEQP